MKYTQDEIKNITDNASVLDYFLYLERSGKVKFERKSGKDYYFRTEDNKFSVSEKKWYDFKTQLGGGAIKAIMSLENKSWKESIDFLKEFNNISLSRDLSERKAKWRKENENKSSIEIQKTLKPNNGNLIDYFAERGIDRDILEKYTLQVHYKINDKYYFGIGIKNESNGFEIRNPYAKTKVGASDISVNYGEKKDEIMVFEGMTNMLSFLQIQKNKGLQTKRTLVTLNSVTNSDKFLDRFKSFSGKVFLALDNDKAGEEASNKIIAGLPNAKVKDIRFILGLEHKEDLNDYLLKNFDNQKNIHNLDEANKIQNEYDKATHTTGISTSQSMGSEVSERNNRSFSEDSQSEQRNNGSGQELGSNNVGDGLGTPEQISLGRERGDEGIGTSTNTQSKNDTVPNVVRAERSGQTSDGLEFREGTFDRQSGSENRESSENDNEHNRDNGRGDNVSHREDISIRGRLNNEEISEIINSIAYVSEGKKIILKDDIVSEQAKEVASQFKSGGITKDGRGVLDEYYTDSLIVDAVRNLIKDQFKGKSEISVLEPSVGTGNFLQATNDLGIKVDITAFEINETSAKIAKILYPNANINLRAFESEFIDDKGNKKNVQVKYDLVIGNPPYGSHRGLYKGLGEESKISKYEDYFVKRSIDVMKEGAVLAMVLPSSWLNRQNSIKGAELANAYRLPNGVFKGTDVGTDIIILKKNSLQQGQDISNYFKENPTKVLGEISTKTNQWNKEVEYIKGNLADALNQLHLLNQQNEIKAEIKNEQIKEVKETIGDLWGDWAEENAQELQKEKIVPSQDSEWDIELNNANEKLSNAITVLEGMKFKSLAVQNKISNFRELQEELKHNKNTFTLDDLKGISEKSDKTIQLKRTDKKTSVVADSSRPEIKKGILKYQFNKGDEVVNASLQKNSNFSEELLLSFQQTDYDGQIYIHESKLRKYANLYKGEQFHDFYYAEGDIYEKLEQLEIDFAGDRTEEQQKQYEKQKNLLESVLPLKKDLEDIIISPNHEFVHKFIVGKIEKNVQTQTGWSIGINPRPMYSWEKAIVDESLAEKFQNFVRNLPDEAFGNSNAWEVNSYVRNESVTGSDRQLNALIRERRKEVANDLFGKFLKEELGDEIKERFVNEFNRKYNNIHIPDYSQFPLFSQLHKNFKGKPLNLTEVQKAGIGRLTTKGVGLLAHEVGFGKTLSGILSMHEAMERGNAKRPLIVVPNDSILKQWIETIYETIPNAKVNVLGNLGKDYDLSNFENEDGEITLVTYEGFNNIGFKKEVVDKLSERFSYITAKDLSGIDNVKVSERDLQKEIAKNDEIKGKMKQGKVYDWEDFAFDHLTFDEVHNANHIVPKVKIEDRRFASDFRNQNQRTSKLGLNTWVASQYIQDRNNGRNVTLLSATPFTNKPLEYYSILSLIANERLEKSGYFNVNTFFETFMEADSEMEITATGDIKNKMNVRRFKNNALFQQLLSEFIDIKGEEDNPELKRPNRINKEYKIEQNDMTRNAYEALNEIFDESKDGAILTHILNARKVAFSPYLSDEYAEENPTVKEFIENSPKLKTTMDLISQNKKDKPEAGQIIYSELGISEFPKLKEYLVSEVGYKDREVAIITGATTKNQRLSIQENFNKGDIKIVIGSEAIQEGMNLQENTSDMYLLTLPYNFTSLRQTEGRAWRQGNKWENVRINFMLTNDSIDVFMLQKLQAKQSRYMEAMKKGANIIDVSDVDTQELKTAIITNPITRAEIEVELLRKKAEAEKNRHSSELGFISRKYEDYIKSKEYVGFKTMTNKEKTALANADKAKESGNTTSYEYWTGEANFYSTNKRRYEIELEKLERKLAEKGVNLSDFQNQRKKTEEKILELDNYIKEELPNVEQKLILQYKQEKEERLSKTSQVDFVSERAEENKVFFKLSTEKEKVAEKEMIEEISSFVKASFLDTFEIDSISDMSAVVKINGKDIGIGVSYILPYDITEKGEWRGHYTNEELSYQEMYDLLNEFNEKKGNRVGWEEGDAKMNLFLTFKDAYDFQKFVDNKKIKESFSLSNVQEEKRGFSR